MLQQTPAKTVIPYFERWMARFSNVAELAAAPLDEVLKAWEGLGYYRRARLLHRAARMVEGEVTGELPRSYADWLKLPGVGPYTAAAIASLACGEDVVAADGNVKRVAARLFKLPGKVSEEAVGKMLEPHLPAGRAGEFNEALMELGAILCLPQHPRCHLCPISAHCQAFQTGETARYPQPAPRRAVPHLERYALVSYEAETFWLTRRPESAMLGGLWGFPLTEALPSGQILKQMLKEVRHAYTHFTITVTPCLIHAPVEGLSGRYVGLEELPQLALSRLDHKILERVAALQNGSSISTGGC
jgi:A/G-specific adenine glycosylase